MTLLDIQLDRLGFLIAAFGYFGFLALQLTVRASTTQKVLFFAYTFASLLWAVFHAYPEQVAFQSSQAFAVETIRQSAMLLFLLSALGKTQLSIREWLQQYKVMVVIAALLVYYMLGSFVLTTVQFWLLSQLLLVIISLAVLETIYRKSHSQRWHYSPLIIGLGLPLLLDFYLLAEAALLDKINPQTWQARGFAHVLMLPFLIIAVKRIKTWGINVYISRDIVLQSSLVLAAGLYLTVLSLVGYYLSYIGGSWTTLLQVSFVIAGTSLLAVVAFSSNVQRKTKVFIEKHFFANSFDYREKWLELTRHMRNIELAKENAAYTCMQGFCVALGYKSAVLLKQDNKALVSLAKSGDIELTDSHLELLQRTILATSKNNWFLDFTDGKTELVVQLKADLSVPFSIFIPIHKNGIPWGCCVLETVPEERRKLNWELRDYLTAVTEQISSYLFMDEASKTLSENAQFMAFSRMSAFVVHDLKNIKAQIDMLLKNAQKHRHNPEFIDDAFTTIEAMQSRMQNMLGQLTNKQIAGEQARTVALAPLIDNLIRERCQNNLPIPSAKVADALQLQIDSERLENVLFHLIDNAQQATDDHGSVSVEAAADAAYCHIVIKDTGCGMSDEFIRNRLFKPFDTTKGNAGMGIGAYDALTFAEQNGGELRVQSEVGKGTTFTMTLPLKSVKSSPHGM